MFPLIIITCVVVFIMMILVTLPIVVNKKSHYIKWGLGVDSACFYSSHFTVNKQRILLVGYQEVLGGKSSIRYSVVKQKWWGETKVYGQAVVYGDYKSPTCYHIAITNIPNGENYRIEVSHSYNISRGKFKIMTE